MSETTEQVKTPSVSEEELRESIEQTVAEWKRRAVDLDMFNYDQAEIVGRALAEAFHAVNSTPYGTDAEGAVLVPVSRRTIFTLLNYVGYVLGMEIEGV